MVATYELKVLDRWMDWDLGGLMYPKYRDARGDETG
jgi:hypothetical protein